MISPIGYGLDEQGLVAIRKWVFAPAMKDGMPVSVLATIEVNFRFPGTAFDSKREAQRTNYNAAIRNLRDASRKAASLETLQKLAVQKYPPAMSLVGNWMIEGSEVAKDVPGGIELVRKAAEKNDGNGLSVLGSLYLEGRGVPADPERGLRLMREASTLGSAGAQFYLGLAYESGKGVVAADPERARYYFRLCAARGTAACQYRLGKMLMPTAGVTQGDAVQALAWLELAAEGSTKEAEPLARSLRATLSDEDVRAAERFKPQLLRK